MSMNDVDMHQTELLDIDEIWKAVRSGMWYPRQHEDVQMANGSDENGISRVWDTMAFVADKLSKLEENSVSPTRGDVVLADFAQQNAPGHIHIGSCSDSELRCILAALHSLSSPWRKLPNELLVEIFSWCISSNAVLSTSHAPLLLTEICSRWHTVSVNTPSLWTSLTLDKNFLVTREVHLRAATDFESRWQRKAFELGSMGSEFMSMILHRSRSLPLSLSSHSGILLQDDTQHLFHDNLFRIKDLALLIPKRNTGGNPPILSADRPLIAPLLETLDIYALQTSGTSSNHKGSWVSPYVHLIQSSASNLRRLTYCVPSSSWPRIDFRQRWDKLTHITWIPGISEGQVVTLFRSAPNLSYASFPEILPAYYDVDPIVQSDPAVMISLDTLVVGARNGGMLFTAITAPNLRHLVHLSPWTQDKHALISFLRRSACPLETLYLYHANYDSDIDLLDILESVEDGVKSAASGQQRTPRKRGHLKALLVTDGHHDRRRLLSDDVMDRLTWRPVGTPRADDLTGPNTIHQRALNDTPPEAHQCGGIGDSVLFPGLEYLSFYDIGSTTAGKLSEMLRSRTRSLIESPESTSISVAKLKMFETWHRNAGLNDISDAEWDEMEALRDDGLVFRLFETSDLRSRMSDAERVLLRRYAQEGLVVRDYSHDIGQFAPIPLEEEACTIISS